jgi:hypothetical protein
MDSKILQLMESADPQDRKKAVKMLAQVGGQEAIRALGTIYKQDSDPEVKDLAIQAGKYIKKQEALGAAPAAPQPSYRAPVVEDEDEDEEAVDEEVEEDFQPVVVPAGKQEQAKGLMDRALDLSMHGEKEKAVESLAKAFKLNPNLRLDSYYMGVAMDITGMDKNAAIRLITTDEKTRKAQNKQKAKNDGTGGGNEEVTWDTALIDLTLYYVIIAGIAIVGMVMFVQAITNGFAAVAASCKDCTPLQVQQMTETVQIFRSLNGLGVAASVIYGLIVALVNIVGLLIYFAILHFFARFIFGGDGTYAGLIHRASLPLMVTYTVTGIIGLITAYLTIRDLFNPEAMRQLSEMSNTASMPSNPLVSLLGPISSFVGLLGSVWFIGRIAQNYEFSWMRGCFADMLTNVAIFALACGCWMVVLSSFVNSLSSMPRMTPIP